MFLKHMLEYIIIISLVCQKNKIRNLAFWKSDMIC